MSQKVVTTFLQHAIARFEVDQQDRNLESLAREILEPILPDEGEEEFASRTQLTIQRDQLSNVRLQIDGCAREYLMSQLTSGEREKSSEMHRTVKELKNIAGVDSMECIRMKIANSHMKENASVHQTGPHSMECIRMKISNSRTGMDAAIDQPEVGSVECFRMKVANSRVKEYNIVHKPIRLEQTVCLPRKVEACVLDCSKSPTQTLSDGAHKYPMDSTVPLENTLEFVKQRNKNAKLQAVIKKIRGSFVKDGGRNKRNRRRVSLPAPSWNVFGESLKGRASVDMLSVDV
ncbi:hypothetical protein SARC_10071 [Sphaeroforma arctica JP610]|uniref:Uncharacterized protein n=1 Tax=Sphaeroforma arctica JP610 TaxID=667725 RepID=A0A0L0FLV8_9EUKA|nr:hypothetical protein SARC_10071 [Sphaeroforma arctica JP610]KNC77466.1 hypothetical protein SARC_10071 [Sphaeroforma arctica JP610]|eukprot:XP_014151368.1 hypothetical protein SARC_10071 [Sphaeroforma arctica JP610]